MKVRIELTLNVDAASWETQFGTPQEHVRADAKVYAAHLLREALEAQDLLLPDEPEVDWPAVARSVAVAVKALG